MSAMTGIGERGTIWEKYDLRGVEPELLQGLNAVAGGGHLVSPSLEVDREQLQRVHLVFDDKNLHDGDVVTGQPIR